MWATKSSRQIWVHSDNTAAKSKKQLQSVELDDLSFFTVNDLPPNVAFFEADLTVGSSNLTINSPDVNFSLVSSTLSFQYRQRNSGNDVIASLRSFQASVGSAAKKDNRAHVICYGCLPSQDLISVSYFSTNRKQDLFGRINRIYVDRSVLPIVVLQAGDFLSDWPVC